MTDTPTPAGAEALAAEEQAAAADRAKLAHSIMPELEQRALLKCWAIERTSGFGDLATLASSVCSAALELAKVGKFVEHHVVQLHRAVDALLDLRDQLDATREHAMSVLEVYEETEERAKHAEVPRG